MKEIPLTNGGVALIDDEDYEHVTQHRWGKYRLGHLKTWYVKQTSRGDDGKQPYLHRFILGVSLFGPRVDHRNGDGLDNQRGNLRKVTQSQNLQNRQGLNADNKTGVRGVCWDTNRRRYLATIGVMGKTINLGRFDTLEEAERVVVEARYLMMTHSDGR